MNSAAQK